jgi:hypothetical protein
MVWGVGGAMPVRLMEIANSVEPEDGRIYIELVNAAFLKAGGTAEQFRVGRSTKGGWCGTNPGPI